MAGNVVVKINPDRPWIVVSAVKNGPRNIAIYFNIFQPLSFTARANCVSSKLVLKLYVNLKFNEGLEMWNCCFRKLDHHLAYIN